MHPTILIPIPTSFDPEYNRQCWPEYAEAIRKAGGNPVAVSLDTTEDDLRALTENAQGILLPGSGADVLPARYGHEAALETSPADAARERIDTLLLEHAERHRTPTLAVCFGLQTLNVFRGGTLVQHLQPVPVNHRAGRAVADAHAAVVAAGSTLGRIVSPAQDVKPDDNDGFLRVMVNSSHHQAIGAPGEGLQVVARSAEDGVIEAVEDASHPFLVGVQWHPERTTDRSDASRRLIEALVAKAVDHA